MEFEKYFVTRIYVCICVYIYMSIRINHICIYADIYANKCVHIRIFLYNQITKECMLISTDAIKGFLNFLPICNNNNNDLSNYIWWFL